VSGAAHSRKGSKLERDAAKVLGGKRMVLSGAVGGGDIALPSGSMWADWSFEAKSRARLPAYFSLAMRQAEAECLGTRRRPAVILKEDRGRIMFACYLDDIVQWTQALSEVGQGAQMKSTIRQIRHQLDDLERRL
jgi:hypothetical protein